MSKITFRADDDLVGRLESLDGSKSEIMREALRSYLDDRQERPRQQRNTRQTVDERSLDELIAGRVDAVIEQQLTERAPTRGGQDRDVNVNVTIDQGETDVNTAESRRTERDRPRRQERNRTGADLSERQSRLCSQCGEVIAGDCVYCPNCGEKASNRTFCECGEETRPDWAYCPRCGRRTPSADVLDRP